MNIKEQINTFITSQPEQKSNDMQELHHIIMEIKPDSKLWFLEGKDENGKVVYNTNIGYGSYTIKYKDGKTKEFFQIGYSPNTTGISVYIMGLEDKKHLVDTYGEKIGKASVTSYCIKFKKLTDINIEVLKEAIKFGFEATS